MHVKFGIAIHAQGTEKAGELAHAIRDVEFLFVAYRKPRYITFVDYPSELLAQAKQFIAVAERAGYNTEDGLFNARVARSIQQVVNRFL